MSSAEPSGRRRLLLLCLLFFLSRTALAEVAEKPAQVQVVVVKGAANTQLAERVRTLFDRTIAVEFREQPALVPAQVLDPARADTVYVFITLGKAGRAQIYVATRESTAREARYLLREVELESGLDEIGAETVAQVAHSSAMALWSRAAETAHDAVAGELAREEPPTPAPPASATATVVAKPPPAEAAPPADARRNGDFSALAWRFGAELAAHASGDEGWLVSPGVFAGFVAFERYGFRLQASYLAPSRFDVPPALVEVSGFGAEARASLYVFRAPELRARVDAGGGLLRIRWEAQEILSEEGSDWSLSSEQEWRPYVVAGISCEVPVGSLLEAALRAELRVLTPPARYDIAVAERREGRAEVRIAPGFALEIWL
jgi:hypothetical protein